MKQLKKRLLNLFKRYFDYDIVGEYLDTSGNGYYKKKYKKKYKLRKNVN